MHVLFVGGLLHGSSAHIADDQKLVEADNPRLKAGRQIYEVRRWARFDAGNGFDAVCVNSFVLPGEVKAKVRDALGTAAKAA